MTNRRIAIDGMLSGTGIRDRDAGGYIKPASLGISEGLLQRIDIWLKDYENAHFFQFQDNKNVQQLDKVGLSIAQELENELPNFDIVYFSNAKMKQLDP